MTVSTSTNRAEFTGNGAQTVFPISFKVFSSADLEVYLNNGTTETLLTISTHYTVSLNSNQETSPGGTVTMLSAPAIGDLLIVLRVVGATQTLDLTTGGAFSPDSIEAALDRITMLVQQIYEIAGRAVSLPVSSSSSGQLPVGEASKYLGWSGDGLSLVNLAQTSIGAGGVDSTLLADLAVITAKLADGAVTAAKTTGLAASGANADITSLSAVTALTNSAGVDIKGTNTNDSAAAGYVGEYIESVVSSGSAVNLAVSSTAYNITSISLSAGDWDVSGLFGITSTNAATSITVEAATISTTSATHDAALWSIERHAAIVYGNGNGIQRPLPTVRLSLASTTPVYLVASATFTVSTCGGHGTLRARRVR